MKTTNTFQFILVLKNVNEATVDLEDSLYEAGCDDALINFRNGAVFLDFDRESSSLEEAVISAIKDVRSASIEADVASVAPEDLVTESEIAKRLNKSRQTISLWIMGKRRKAFPAPVMRLSEKSPLWSWYEVISWLHENKIIENKGLVDDALFFVSINHSLKILKNRKEKDLEDRLLARIE